MKTSYETLELFIADLVELFTRQRDIHDGEDDIILFKDLHAQYEELGVAAGLLIYYLDITKTSLLESQAAMRLLESELENTCYLALHENGNANRPKTLIDARRKVLSGDNTLRVRLVNLENEIQAKKHKLDILEKYQETLNNKRWNLKHITEMWIVERKKEPV